MLEYEEVEHEEAWLVVEGKCVCEGGGAGSGGEFFEIVDEISKLAGEG